MSTARFVLLSALMLTSSRSVAEQPIFGEMPRWAGGWGVQTRHEVRRDGDWVPFCEPYEESHARAICRPGEKGMFANYQDSMPNGEWKTYQTETIDFELRTYVAYSPATVGKVTFFCKRQK